VLLLEYSLGVRDVLSLFEKPYIKSSKKKLSRFQIFSDNEEEGVSFLNIENHKIKFLPDWNFNCLDNKFSEFNNTNIIKLKTNDKKDTIYSALKLFPNAFLITFDTKLVNFLKITDLELGIFRKKDSYRCYINKNNLENASCKRLFGRNKQNFLIENNCYIKCRYLRDVQNCKNFKIGVMRPFTFLAQMFKVFYKPRCLMVIDDYDSFCNSLKSYFSFSLPYNSKKEYFKFLKDTLNEKIFKLKFYEKKGWLNLIEGLRGAPPKDERFSSFNPNIYKWESNETLYHFLKKKGTTGIEGLDYNDFSKFWDIKSNIFKMNLALKAKESYIVKNGVHIPASIDHIWETLITKYAKYFLILQK
jgi:hypothetical protein